MRGELGSLYLSLAISSVIFCLPGNCQHGGRILPEARVSSHGLGWAVQKLRCCECS